MSLTAVKHSADSQKVLTPNVNDLSTASAALGQVLGTVTATPISDSAPTSLGPVVITHVEPRAFSSKVTAERAAKRLAEETEAQAAVLISEGRYNVVRLGTQLSARAAWQVNRQCGYRSTLISSLVDDGIITSVPVRPASRKAGTPRDGEFVPSRLLKRRIFVTPLNNPIQTTTP